MHIRILTRLIFPLFCVTLFASSAVSPAAAAPNLPLGPDRATEIPDRTLDPVVVSGAQMPAFGNVPLDDLFVYVYDASDYSWTQIPWQFDEVHDGLYVALEDGKLDADDELAFMIADGGDMAPPGQWITDPASRNYPRYQIAVTDPLQPQNQEWVYVYRSPTLTRNVNTDYVDYNARVVTSDTYLLGLMEGNLIAERLELNNTGGDFLDRTKVRIAASGLSLTEDDLVFDPDSDAAWRLIHDGQVRTIVQFSAYEDGQLVVMLTLTNYRAMFLMHPSLDLSAYISTLDEFRFSADLTPAVVGGTYYDANTTAGVTVDGTPDGVPATPLSSWNQVSHPTLGSIVQVIDSASLGGTQRTYYKDDDTVDPDDTGDQRSYADCGIHVTNSNANLAFDVWYYTLPAAQPNVGSTYADYAENPLQAEASEQHWTCAAIDEVDIEGPTGGYTDTLYTFTAIITPTDASRPITYTWSPQPEDGQGTESADYRWDTPGIYTITLSAENCGGPVSTTHTITVEPSCTPLNEVAVNGPSTGYVGTLYTFTAVITPTEASEPITYTWSPQPEDGQGTESADYRWDTPGIYTITLSAENCGGPVSETHTVTVEAGGRHIYLPLVLRSH
ncbi:MAG: hypothetical protein DRI80_16995 [Chloroflexota bacterium]|nr:MAG: hypothetical protein DRI80_16995 [Chloroflexota bacterium]